MVSRDEVQGRIGPWGHFGIEAVGAMDEEIKIMGSTPAAIEIEQYRKRLPLIENPHR